MAWFSGSGHTMKIIGSIVSLFDGYNMISAINRTRKASQAASDVKHHFVI